MWQDNWILARFFSDVFMDLHRRKHVDKERGQHPGMFHRAGLVNKGFIIGNFFLRDKRAIADDYLAYPGSQSP